VPICAAAGGAKDLIINGINGFSPEPGDVEGFVRAIEHVMYHPDRRAKLRQNAYDFAQEQSWDSIIDRMLSLYARASGGAAVPAAA
jgi:glycosyltransferase involved in cell wall biosynthesis